MDVREPLPTRAGKATELAGLSRQSHRAGGSLETAELWGWENGGPVELWDWRSCGTGGAVGLAELWDWRSCGTGGAADLTDLSNCESDRTGGTTRAGELQCWLS